MAKKNRLKDSERRAIVIMLAVWSDYGEILEYLGRDVAWKTIQSYNGGTPRNRGRLAQKWLRLRELNRIFSDGKRASDTDLQLAALDRARAESPQRMEHEIGISYEFIELLPHEIPNA